MKKVKNVLFQKSIVYHRNIFNRVDTINVESLPIDFTNKI